MNRKSILGSLIVLLILFNINCKDSKFMNGQLIISLTDKPFPVGVMESVEVTINQIDISDSEHYKALFKEDITVDLIELTNGNTYELHNSEVLTGFYSNLKVYMSSAVITLKDGRSYICDINDEVLEGVKVNINTNVKVKRNKNKNVLLDFDISKSFIPMGNINNPSSFSGFRFRPVLKAVDEDLTGNVSGKITNTSGQAVSDATIELQYSNISYSTTFSNTDGNYKFIGVEENKYSAIIEAEGYISETFKNFQVKKNKEIKLNVILESE